MALTIVQHPEASVTDKVLAGSYVAAEASAYVTLIVGGAALACGLTPACAAVVEPALGIGYTTAATTQTATVVGATGTTTTAAAEQVVQQVGQATQSPTGQRIILWMENQLNRVEHIMAAKHGWDQLAKLSGDILQDYQAVQPYIQQAVNSGAGSQINQSPLGPVMEYVTTVAGQSVVVRAIELANGAIQITDAWVKIQ